MKLRKNKLLLVLVSIVGFIAVMGATIIVLELLTPSTPAVQSSKEAVELFTQKAPEYLENKGFSKMEKPTNELIYYTPIETGKYSIYATASKYVLYTSKDMSIDTIDSTIIKQFETLYKKHGLKLSSSNNNKEGYLTKQFTNDTVVCQTDQWQKTSTQGASYGIACKDISEVSKKYEEIDSLLNKALSDISLSDIRFVSTTNYEPVKGKEIKKLVTKQADASSRILYFFNSNNELTYIGMRPAPNVDIEDSFIIPDKLKEAVEASPDREVLAPYILKNNT